MACGKRVCKVHEEIRGNKYLYFEGWMKDDAVSILEILAVGSKCADSPVL